YCGAAHSSDGGNAWGDIKPLEFHEATSPAQVSETPEFPICGDPVAGVNQNGRIFAAAAFVGSPSWTQGVYSDDEGGSWSQPSEVFGATQMVNAAAGNLGTAKTPAIGM